MFISQLKLNNFRGFSEDESTIEFKEGINVILGENNAGKTTVIKALDILFNTKSSKKLSINDFNRNIQIEVLKSEPPRVTLSAKLVESSEEDAYSDELLSVANWLVKLEPPYEAQVTYEFFLPDNELEIYREIMGEVTGTDPNKYWKTIEQHFINKYVSRFYVGNPVFKNQLNQTELSKFDFQFLSAIRDVERDLFKGNNSLLKDVIDFYMDYDIKSDEMLEEKDKIRLINEKKNEFAEGAKELIELLKKRMVNGEEQILEYVKATGAGIDESKAKFEGEILDSELYSTLRLIVEKVTGIKLPATSNGLGYNNLIYISILLSKMQRDSSGDYLGSNAKAFSVLAIEEPEAHLHPSMQYKFLQFLKNNKSKVRQIFITTHSPNITAAVDLEDIIIIQKFIAEGKECVKPAYPSKVFKDISEIPEEKKSMEYVRRFLDVTKADLFFAKNIILVEGIAEQLIIPNFSRKMGLGFEDSHTTIINIGGRYFNHFLKLFDLNNSEFALHKKVACITDLDPVRKLKEETTTDEEDVSSPITEIDESNGWKKCPPIFLDLQPEKYEYKKTSNKLLFIENNFSENIKIFSQELGLSSTLEYDLVLANPNLKDLVTDTVSNNKELKELFDMVSEEKSLLELAQRLRKCKFKSELLELIDSSLIQDNNDNKVGLVAYRYLSSINKGEAAQELAYLINATTVVNPPKYIEEAIKWISC